MHIAKDKGTNPNALNLTEAELKKRTVEYIGT
jgi:hypothetical protein